MNEQALPTLRHGRRERSPEMRPKSQRLPVHLAFAGTASQCMPGVLIGCMFVLTSVAFSSLTDRETLLLKMSSSARDPGVDSCESPTVVRSFLQPQAALVGTQPVLSRETAVKNGLRVTSSQFASGPVERVTLEIPAGYAAADHETQFQNRKELLQILSRRREKLELRMTLRVSPEHLADAVRLATELSKDCAVPAAHVVVSADNSLNADSLVVDVFRSARQQDTEVTQR